MGRRGIPFVVVGAVGHREDHRLPRARRLGPRAPLLGLPHHARAAPGRARRRRLSLRLARAVLGARGRGRLPRARRVRGKPLRHELRRHRRAPGGGRRPAPRDRGAGRRPGARPAPATRASSSCCRPPSTALEARLRGRGSDEPAEIRARLELARRELGAVDLFDYAVVNDALEPCVAALREIIDAERRGDAAGRPPPPRTRRRVAAVAAKLR